MNTCGTCKFKGKPFEGWSYPDGPLTGFFLRTRIEHNDETHSGRIKRKIQPDTKAFVVDGSDYYAALCVDSDFGCNQWEQA